MKKLIYLTAVAGSLLLTTSCVDLTQETPNPLSQKEEYWNTVDQASLEKAADAFTAIYGKEITDSTAVCNASMYVRMILPTVQPRPITNWLIIAD
mgnify:CR=1 FL=1